VEPHDCGWCGSLPRAPPRTLANSSARADWLRSAAADLVVQLIPGNRARNTPCATTDGQVSRFDSFGSVLKTVG